jgi:hypothetical protein
VRKIRIYYNLVKGVSTFSTSSVSITKGSTITFVDDTSNGALHILVVGQNGQQDSDCTSLAKSVRRNRLLVEFLMFR